MRHALFEFEDFEWFPGVIRDGGLDYLRYVLKATHFYDCVAPVINHALEQTGDSSIVDLCSAAVVPSNRSERRHRYEPGEKYRLR